MAKMKHEATQISIMCSQLNRMFEIAGTCCTFTYDNRSETIKVAGEIDTAINVCASSARGVIVDIFTQLAPRIREVI